MANQQEIEKLRWQVDELKVYVRRIERKTAEEIEKLQTQLTGLKREMFGAVPYLIENQQQGTYGAGAMQLRCGCSADAVRMRLECGADAMQMICECGADAAGMQCECEPGAAVWLEKSSYAGGTQPRCCGRCPWCYHTVYLTRSTAQRSCGS
jgi:hypothetical protein